MTGQIAVTPSALDDNTLAALRQQAAAYVSQFIDPALVRAGQLRLPAADRSWLERVIGRDEARGWRYLGNAELWLALAALDIDAAHIESAAAAGRAAWRAGQEPRVADGEAARRADEQAWAGLRAALPVRVEVQHNWTPRHLDGYEQGGDHIVVLAGLHSGRLHRAPHECLCETPSRARQLRHVGPVTGDEKRIPNCQACLAHARRLADRNTPSKGTPR